MKTPNPVLLSALGAASSFASVSLEAQPTYRITEIPAGCADAINDREQVVGEMTGINGATALLWSTSTGLIDIGAIADFHHSRAHDINDAGQIVGIKGDGSTYQFEDGFLWDPVKGEPDLPDLPGTVQTYAQAVAAGGQATGSNIGSSGYGHAVLWTNEAVIDLGDLPGGSDSSGGLGINDRGEKSIQMKRLSCN